ncbi:hypothetical protein [Paenibacillus piri]|uniref:hypothetical protein n=1 Tax=Paenibacillus piri TaxID=2547395 RepID=UPI0014044E38|nr:hypothetical protein [Paenibacillus piri]
MIPTLLFQIALIIIIARSVYELIQRLNAPSKMWFEILFQASVAIVALKFLL